MSDSTLKKYVSFRTMKKIVFPHFFKQHFFLTNNKQKGIIFSSNAIVKWKEESHWD